MGSQLLVHWITSYFLSYLDCHLFQQQFVFNIEINGSVIFQNIGTVIRSSHDSKWQACMREADADRSWQADHGKPWTSIRNFFLDEMYKEDPTEGIPDWLQPFTVNLEDLEMHVFAHSSERAELRFGKVMLQKWRRKKWKHRIHTNFRKYRKRSVPRTEEIGDLKAVEGKRWISEQSPVRCRGTRSHHSVDTTREKPKLRRRGRRILWKFSEPSQKPKVIGVNDW